METRNRQTPQERLTSEKNRIKNLCRLQEQKLNNDWDYIRNNSIELIFSGISSILFPKKQSNDKKQENPGESIFFTFKGVLPVIWDVIKPILVTWLLKKAGNFITKFGKM